MQKDKSKINIYVICSFVDYTGGCIMKKAKEIKLQRAVVTGMGFALPGIVATEGIRMLCKDKSDFWNIISTGTSCIENNGVYYGYIHQSDEELKRSICAVPEKYMKNYNKTHLLSLISCEEACKDAGLEINEYNFKDAAVLTARTSIASCIDSYNAFINMDYEKASPNETLQMFHRLMLSVPVNDAAMVQSAMLQSGGDQFSISCGCASGGVLIGEAQRMIMTGQTDCVVVTGVETISEGPINHFVNLVDIANKTGRQASFDAPPTAFILDKLMAPYDKSACGYNSGIGSATLIIESEERALSRGARIYGEIINQSTARGNSKSAVTLDQTGKPLIKSITNCIKDYVSIDEIGYINGGAQGDKIFNIFESNALRELFGNKVKELVVTSQEACFGHNSSTLGITGVAGTLLMMNNNEICPTTGCREQDEICCFNSLPGKETYHRKFDYAISVNYQAGGVCSSILLGRY